MASLPAWAQKLVLALLPSGGWGLFIIAFLDSSFLTFPILNDLFVVWLSIRHPQRMLFYATMATAGSILGCVVIYYLAKKGGEAMLRRKAQPEQIERISRWYEKYEFLTITVPAVLPPPTPFKVFIIAAGVFQVRLRHFLTAVILGRGVRYYLEGFLAVRYGEQTITFLRQNFLQVSLIAVLLVAVGFLVIRMASRRRTRPFQTPAS
ncbi:MAG: YqaA family protein [Terriglobia bacterium]